MPKFLKDLIEAFGAFRNYLFFRCLIGGLVISLVAVAVVGILAGTITLINVYPFFDIDSEKYVSTLLASGFIILWLLIALSGYLASSKEFDDIYSWLRDRLIGTWEFQLESWRRNEEKQWVRAFMSYPTHIFVDPRTRKLRARVLQRHNEFFEDAEFDSGILHIDENGSAYKLYLILNVKQELRAAYKAAAHIDTVDMNLLVSLDINPRETGPSQESLVKRMRGIWYDVDNVLWHLVAEANTEETMEQLWNTFDNNVNNFQGKIIADRTDLKSD